jgi:glucosyl-3-phosphoglycerate synthase
MLPGLTTACIIPPAVLPIEWFEGRTFHHQRFGDLRKLAQAKEAQGVSVSVCIPTLNEEATIGPIVRAIRKELMRRHGLVDELVVMDSASVDATARAAEKAGAMVVQDRDVLPDLEPLSGKGEAMWKSLFVTRGDVVAWLDADIQEFHPRFVYGVLGPILTDPGIGFVKAFYERPLTNDGKVSEAGGGRVTELMARPLINMFWPHLAPVIQPLSGECAGRRSLLEQLPFFTGYGVDLGMLIDVGERFGLETMAQVDLDRRIHRNRTLGELSRMSYAVLQATVRRLTSSGRLTLPSDPSPGLYQFERGPEGTRMEPALIDVRERPPAITIAGYGAAR